MNKKMLLVALLVPFVGNISAGKYTKKIAEAVSSASPFGAFTIEKEDEKNVIVKAIKHVGKHYLKGSFVVARGADMGIQYIAKKNIEALFGEKYPQGTKKRAVLDFATSVVLSASVDAMVENGRFITQVEGNGEKRTVVVAPNFAGQIAFHTLAKMIAIAGRKALPERVKNGFNTMAKTTQDTFKEGIKNAVVSCPILSEFVSEEKAANFANQTVDGFSKGAGIAAEACAYEIVKNIVSQQLSNYVGHQTHYIVK